MLSHIVALFCVISMSSGICPTFTSLVMLYSSNLAISYELIQRTINIFKLALQQWFEKEPAGGQT